MSLKHQNSHAGGASVAAAHHSVSAGVGRPAVVPVQKREGEIFPSAERDIPAQMKDERPSVPGSKTRPAVKPFQMKRNNTGLPDNLKNGIENISGFAMDDVNVHYNSSRPAQLQALAFAQGTDIHVAPGQEQHLAHEAWHVVQQKQGRVNATFQMKGGVSVNDDQGLESEADVMGQKAASFDASSPAPLVQRMVTGSVVQMLPKSYVRFSKTNVGGYEVPEKMDANPLSTVPGNTVGSKPIATNEGKLISTLKTKRPGSYEAGHLLNQEFHGPGDHRNLVPLTYATNNLMANTIEQFVRSYISRGEVVAYQVRVNYGVTGRVNIKEENYVPESLDFRMTPQKEVQPGQWEDKKVEPPLVINIRHELPPDTVSLKAPSKKALNSVKGQQRNSLHSFFSPVTAVADTNVLDNEEEMDATDAIEDVLTPDAMTEFERKANYKPLRTEKNWLNETWFNQHGRNHYGNRQGLENQLSDNLQHPDLGQGIVPLDEAVRILGGQRQEMIGNVKDDILDSFMREYLEYIMSTYPGGVPEVHMEAKILQIRGFIIDKHTATKNEEAEMEVLNEMDDEQQGILPGKGVQPDTQNVKKEVPNGKRTQYSFTYQRSFFLPTDKDWTVNKQLHGLKATIEGGITEANALQIYQMLGETQGNLLQAASETEPGVMTASDNGTPVSFSKEYYDVLIPIWMKLSDMVSADPMELVGWQAYLKAWIGQVTDKSGRLF